MTGRSRREDLKGKARTLAIAFKFRLNSNSFVIYVYICRKKRNLSLECLSLLACSPNRVWYPLGHALFYRWPHMQHEIANCLLVQASSAVYILQQVERGSKHSTAWWSPSFQKKASVFIRFETSPGHFLNFLSLSMSHLATFGHICGHICGHIAQVKPSQHLEGDRPLTTDVIALTSTKIFSCIISSNISCISCLFAWHCTALHGIARHCMALHGIAWHCMALHGIARHCMALHGIAWYCCCYCWWFAKECKRLSIFTHYVARAYNTSSGHLSDVAKADNPICNQNPPPDSLCKIDPSGSTKDRFFGD